MQFGINKQNTAFLRVSQHRVTTATYFQGIWLYKPWPSHLATDAVGESNLSSFSHRSSVILQHQIRANTIHTRQLTDHHHHHHQIFIAGCQTATW